MLVVLERVFLFKTQHSGGTGKVSCGPALLQPQSVGLCAQVAVLSADFNSRPVGQLVQSVFRSRAASLLGELC